MSIKDKISRKITITSDKYIDLIIEGYKINQKYHCRYYDRKYNHYVWFN